MTLDQILFFILAAFTIVMASLVVFSKNPIHSVLYLILTMVGISGHYFLLQAQFLGAVQIIVYAGAVMVLFLSVFMLLDLKKDNEPQKSMKWSTLAVMVGVALMGVLCVALYKTNIPANPEAINPTMGFVKNLGKLLFTDYVVPFEISSVLFLAAIVGAIHLGQKRN
jgi:NADH-quinone oxidoreductase subunit J